MQWPYDNYYKHLIFQRSFFQGRSSVLKQKMSQPTQAADRNILKHSLEKRPLTRTKQRLSNSKLEFVTRKTPRILQQKSDCSTRQTEAYWIRLR